MEIYCRPRVLVPQDLSSSARLLRPPRKRRLQLKRSLLPRRQPRNVLPKNPRERKPRNQQPRRQRTPNKETKVCQKAKGRQKTHSKKTQGSQEASQQAKTQEVSQKGGQEAKQGWKEEVNLRMADLNIVSPACGEAYKKTAF